MQDVLRAVRRGDRLSDALGVPAGSAEYHRRRRQVLRSGGWLPCWSNARPGSALRTRIVRFIIEQCRRRGPDYGARGVRNALREAGIARVPLSVVSRIMCRVDPEGFLSRVAIVGGGGRLRRIEYENDDSVAVLHADSYDKIFSATFSGLRVKV